MIADRQTDVATLIERVRRAGAAMDAAQQALNDARGAVDAAQTVVWDSQKEYTEATRALIVAARTVDESPK